MHALTIIGVVETRMWMLMLLFFVQLQEHAVDKFNSPSYIVQKNTETLPYCANPISK